MKFLELTMRNFRSYGNNVTTVKLDFDKPTLIVGKNYDDVVDGQVDSNGAGKTTILDAISVCCYDKTITGIEKGDMINYANGKNMEISVTFEKNNKFYKIVRYRANKALGGDGVKLYVNSELEFTEEHDKTKDSIANTTKEIENIIGIPFEIFSRIVIFSASYEPFLNLPFSHASKENQKDVFEELFGLTELTRKAETLKGVISATKKSIESLVKKNELLEQELNRHINHLEQTKTKELNWAEANKNSIRELKNELKPLIKLDVETLSMHLSEINEISAKELKLRNDINVVEREIYRIIENNKKHNKWDVDKETSIKDLNSKIEELKKIDVDKFRKIEEELREHKRLRTTITDELNRQNDRLNDINKEIINKQNEIKHLDSGECPYCKQEFLENKNKIHECIAEVATFNTTKDLILNDIGTLENELEKLDSLILNAPSIPSNLDGIESQLIKAQAELDVIISSSNPFIVEDVFAFEATIMDLKLDLEECESNKNDILSKVKKESELLSELGYSLTTESIQKIESDIDRKADRLELLQNEINPYSEMVVEIEEIVKDVKDQILVDEIDKLNSDLEHQNFLLKLLTKKDSFVRKALLNKNIPFLNGRMSHYLKKTGLSHKVEFDEEMMVHISKFGTTYKYKALSSGQRARINLALVFAFRDVLQARFDKINFYILDECLDVGLGNVGVQLATKMIKTVAIENDISMFIISHRDEISNMFDNKLQIELRNGFSTIVTE